MVYHRQSTNVHCLSLRMASSLVNYTNYYSARHNSIISATSIGEWQWGCGGLRVAAHSVDNTTIPRRRPFDNLPHKQWSRTLGCRAAVKLLHRQQIALESVDRPIDKPLES